MSSCLLNFTFYFLMDMILAISYLEPGLDVVSQLLLVYGYVVLAQPVTVQDRPLEGGFSVNTGEVAYCYQVNVLIGPGTLLVRHKPRNRK